MTRKVAVAIIHGVGTQTEDFAAKMAQALDDRCRPHCGDDIRILPVFWANLLSDAESELARRLSQSPMRWGRTRRFLIDFIGDAFAYQITAWDRRLYDAIHQVFAKTLNDLAHTAGENAPLCVIAHSLGSVIASNFIYDLQVDSRKHLIAPLVRAVMTQTPLERGETLTLLYTMGSPIALWSLRYHRYGWPIRVPDRGLKRHYPDLCPQAEWINFYDADDAIGFPLKPLNRAYNLVVTEDRQVNVGSPLLNWTPASHLGYWSDNDVLDPIASRLIQVWKTVNPQGA